MPFGTHIEKGDRVNFRLWAPSADEVELCLQSQSFEYCLPMEQKADGWYNVTTGFAAKGFYYKYRINRKHTVPDPASRYQPEDVNGPSQVIDPEEWQWSDQEWKGLPWKHAVFYQVHVGTFSEEGTFGGVKKQLDYLVDLGITAIQLMPIADFSGRYNWGYDGVLPFAPDSRYGSPDDLKDLIDSAHAKGLMVFNDVIYNHFGPEGNYLHLYAPAFFTQRYKTPWGEAIDFDPKRCHWVRQFFIDNALYWLEEYHFDGLRLDAVHAIFDNTTPNFLEQLAEVVRQRTSHERHVYLVLENDNNSSHYLRHDKTGQYRYFDAQWNDDIHHALHVLLTGENTGYYQDYQPQPIQYLGRCLTKGFAYQGEPSPYRDGKRRGDYCADLPLSSFISFLQNHDQIGNRALGERISCLCSAKALRAATAIVLLIPSPPLFFMGQEWACSRPFNYFVDFSEPLGEQVSQGRLQTFSKFPLFTDKETQQKIPPPNCLETYQAAKLPWQEMNQPANRQWLEFHRELLRIRHSIINQRISDITGEQAHYRIWEDRALSVNWYLSDGSILVLIANLSNDTTSIDYVAHGEVLFASDTKVQMDLNKGYLRPWSVIFLQSQGQ
jgi:maltooligosyltrehalose trehalohydrolase